MTMLPTPEGNRAHNLARDLSQLIDTLADQLEDVGWAYDCEVFGKGRQDSAVLVPRPKKEPGSSVFDRPLVRIGGPEGITMSLEQSVACQALTEVALEKYTLDGRRLTGALTELRACLISLTKAAELLARSEAQMRLDTATTSARATVAVLAGVTRRTRSATTPPPKETRS